MKLSIPIGGIQMALALGLTALCLATQPGVVSAQTDEPSDSEIATIESLLEQQARCWNRGDIDGFMETYWKSDALTFSGGGRTTRGWAATRDRYKKRYPRGKMGHLTFDELETSLLSDRVALVLGRWHLKMDDGPREGNFTLVLKKFDDGWKIVHDHSSTLEDE